MTTKCTLLAIEYAFYLGAASSLAIIALSLTGV